ncbi:MAG: alanine racemase [Candidatus Competibacteraceae bacterium]|nr:alanine racemase [Candidatus Competibacteraceae bacterium]
MKATWVEISREALHHNLDELACQLAHACEQNKGPAIALGLVVKGDAYGHGLLPVVSLAAAHPAVSYFFTASLQEALEVRALAPSHGVCALVPADSQFLDEALANAIDLVGFSEHWCGVVSERAQTLGIMARIHIKLETGLARLGIPMDDVVAIVRRIVALPNIELVGVMTHLADVVGDDIPFAREQRVCFEQACSQLRAAGISWRWTHANASGGLSFVGVDTLVRVGTALYGYWKSEPERVRSQSVRGPFDLKPVLTWKSRVMHCAYVEPGQTIGYGQTFCATRPMSIAVIPVGYSDGYPRSLSNQGAVLIKGQLAPVVGRVSMNVLTVDVTDIPGACDEGELLEVILVGPQQGVTADKVAQKRGP